MVMKLMKDTDIISIISTITQDADCYNEQPGDVMITMMFVKDLKKEERDIISSKPEESWIPFLGGTKYAYL